MGVVVYKGVERGSGKGGVTNGRAEQSRECEVGGKRERATRKARVLILEAELGFQFGSKRLQLSAEVA
ncbi:hypothetical protein V6N12_064417 [Hibiscus sabdariffa]|uniref:Uncharacterized protein n=1 Tax=Hibiscus sabdariffa TaxID=183260 RepID=A0ABR2G6L5_9ROSI